MIVWQTFDLDAETTEKPVFPHRSRWFSSCEQAVKFVWTVWDEWEEPCIRAVMLDVTPPDEGYLLFATNGLLKPHDYANINVVVHQITDRLLSRINGPSESDCEEDEDT